MAMKRVGISLAGAWGCALFLFVVSPTQAGVWSAGHGDFGPEVGPYSAAGTDVELGLHFHDGEHPIIDGVPWTGGEEYPGELTIQVPKIDAVYRTRYSTSNELWRPGEDQDVVAPKSLQQRLGLAASDKFWNLPDNPELGGDYPFLGSGFHADTWVGSILQVTLSLVDFSGPGEFVLWEAGRNLAHIQTADAGGSAGTFVYKSSHTHLNWAFSKPGEYALTFRADVTDLTPGGVGYIGYGEDTLHFSVVPEPSSLTLAGLGAVGLISTYALRRRRMSRRVSIES